MVQAVSHRLPTAAVPVRYHVGNVGFVVDKVALEQVSSAYSHSTDCSTVIYRPGLLQ
jgi:hypothetical protein